MRSTSTASSRHARVTLTLLASAALACQVPGDVPRDRPGPVESQASAVIQPSGFTDSVVFSGRSNPVAVRFAPNGRVFVVENAGRVWTYDNISDTSATLVLDYSARINTFLDRGLSGLAIDPNYPATPHLYLLYTHDTATNAENGTSIANRNASDNCPTPPGQFDHGCLSFGVLSRVVDTGNYPLGDSAETVLVTEWPQQYSGHSVQHLTFGPDGFLYASAGDGAMFDIVDLGTKGIPVNPTNDPAGSRGALRVQSLRRPAGQNVVMNGAVIRIDKNTGAAAATNPNISHPDPDGQRIVAFGLRNPFRFTFHPGTGDIWVGDVGAQARDEINRFSISGTVENFGWPCYEGPGRQGGYDSANVAFCEDLYPTTQHVAPFFSYAQGQTVFSGDACGTSGGMSISGLAFYPSSGGNFPTKYHGGLFFSDYARGCIWTMDAGAGGNPNTATVASFATGLAGVMDLQVGPGGDLYYVNYTAGTVRRIRYLTPSAIATATPTVGAAPLTVQFSGAMSTKVSPTDTLSYAWDMDADGQYDDATGVSPSFVFATSGIHTARLRVTDQLSRTGFSNILTITVGNPPAPVIDTPLASDTWVVDQTISFSGHATDPDEGTLPDSALSWELLLEHCPDQCHSHSMLTWTGVASGSFPAPDHSYPSFLRLVLRATDSTGITTIATRDLQPQTVNITFDSAPVTSPRLMLGFNSESVTTPFTRTVIVGSAMTVSAPAQVVGAMSYAFQSWSDGGAANHTIVAGASPATHTATFVGTPAPLWTSQDVGAVAAAGSWSESNGVHTIAGNGADIWTTVDEFRFTHQQLAGDGTITARVTSFNSPTNVNGKAGVMIRQSLNANSAHVMATMPPAGTATAVKAIKRPSTGATSVSEAGPAPSFPRWVRVVRSGATLTAFQSTNGTSFTQLGTPSTISGMTGTVFVGLAVSSHTDGTNGTAVFDNVTVTTPAPPSAPAGLVASGGVNQAVLNWTDNSNNETGFKIERKLAADPDTGFAQVGTAGVNATSFTNTSVPAGSYSYRVRASGSPTDSGYSNTANATVSNPPPPGAPSGLSASDGVNQSVLAWTDTSSNETGFEIERKPAGDPDTSYTQVGTTGANVATFTNTSVPAGVYSYRVKATNGSGDSPPSNEDDATVTDPQPPAAPSDLTANGGSAQASLAWTDNANNEAGFKIERKPLGDPDTSFAQVGTATANATGFINTSVPAGSFTYRVRATNAVGDSEYSNTADATVTVPSGPTAPTNLNANTANGNSATLTWMDTSSNETGFRVERKVGAGSYATLATKAAGAVTHIDAGPLTPNTYTYRVLATGSPDSGPSNEVVVVINNPVADSYVREGTNAGINYGTETFIKIKLNTTVANNRRGYVRFSLANVAATVTSAKLRLYGVATTNTKNVGAHAVSNITWGETTITFGNAPAMTSPAIQTRPITTTAGYVEWDVTSYIQQQRAANATAVSLGLLTTSSFADTETNINARENAANKPILIISSRP